MVAYIFCAFPFATVFCEDLENKYIRYSIIRGNLKKYVFSQISIIYLTSIAVMVLGTAIFLDGLPYNRSLDKRVYRNVEYAITWKLWFSFKDRTLFYVLYIVFTADGIAVWFVISSGCIFFFIYQQSCDGSGTASCYTSDFIRNSRRKYVAH